MNSDGLEGFLCPACKKDLGDGARLVSHYEEEHDESERLFRFPIKDLFDKAKQKLLKSDLLAKESCFNDTIEGKLETSVENQDLGAVVSHTSYFKNVRDQQVDKAAVETNNLLIRLDKLINEMPSDLSKRKAFERGTIPWLNDSEATNCKLCGAKFSLTRRKHHCRLCGKILCSSCSKFLKFSNANKMVNPSYAIAYHNEAENTMNTIRKELPSTSKTPPIHLTAADQIARRLSAAGSNLNFRQAERIFLTGLSKLKGDGSEEGEQHLRVCSLCHELLDRRDKQTEQRTSNPLIVQIYDRLAALINDLNRQYGPYQEMSLALNRGESKYDLKAVKGVLSQIEISIQQIKYVLSKLNQLISESGQPSNVDQNEEHPNGIDAKLASQEIALVRSILRFALAFVSDVAVRLIKLPEPEEYERLRENLRIKLEASISQERALVAATIKTSSSYDRSLRTECMRDQSLLRQKSKSPDEYIANTDITPSDRERIIRTYEEQILKIQNDIMVSTIECKLDEVDILSKHLNELKIELSRMRTENHAKRAESSAKMDNVESQKI